jgi:hypothetical protein
LTGHVAERKAGHGKEDEVVSAGVEAGVVASLHAGIKRGISLK